MCNSVWKKPALSTIDKYTWAKNSLAHVYQHYPGIFRIKMTGIQSHRKFK